MPYTREQWSHAMLASVPINNTNPSQDLVNWIVAWTMLETATGQGASYNLLNTTQVEPGSTPFNDLGNGIAVQNFTNFAQGTSTNAKVIGQVFYPNLFAALSKNQVPFVNSTIDNELRTWGTGPVSAKIVSLMGQGLADSFPGTGPVGVNPYTLEELQREWNSIFSTIRSETGIYGAWSQDYQNGVFHGPPVSDEYYASGKLYQQFTRHRCHWDVNGAHWS